MFIAKGLTKDYATRVLDAVDIEFAPGEIHALLGSNGAGKSTLCKIMAGLSVPTSGEMNFHGQIFNPRSKKEAEQAGIQIVQQELNLVPNLDVAHSLYLSRLPNRFGWIDRRKLYADARKLLDAFDLQAVSPRSLVHELGVGQRQMLEIASNLDRNCRLLILDEPTAALSIRETERLFEKLLEAKGCGVAMVYVSHRLEEVCKIADRVSILCNGKRVITCSIEEIDQKQMVELMTAVSTPVEEKQTGRSPSKSSGSPALRVRGIQLRPDGKRIEFGVQRGEVVGLAGLVGAGRSRLLRQIYGVECGECGEIAIGEKPYRPLLRSAAEAVELGMGMLGEDRKGDGLLLEGSICDNIVLSNLSRSAWRENKRELAIRNGVGVYRTKNALKVSDGYRKRLHIQCQDVTQRIDTLSGGNQQKAIFAKWLYRDVRILLLDEPTRGIDVSSRHMIYGLLEEWCSTGGAILVASSDLEELMTIADRILVLSNGEVAAEYDANHYSQREMTRSMFEGYCSRVIVR